MIKIKVVAMSENYDVVVGTPMYHSWTTKTVGKGDYTRTVRVKQCDMLEEGSWPQKYLSNEAALKVKACPKCVLAGFAVPLPRPVKYTPTVGKEKTAKTGLFLIDYLDSN